jgi:hypothetical protein
MKTTMDASVYELVLLVDSSVTQNFAFRGLPREGRLALILRELVRAHCVQERRDDHIRSLFAPAGRFALLFGVEGHGLEEVTYEWDDLAEADGQLVSMLRNFVRQYCASELERNIAAVSTIFAFYRLGIVNFSKKTSKGIKWNAPADCLERIEELKTKSNGKTPKVVEYLDEAGTRRLKIQQQ